MGSNQTQRTASAVSTGASSAGTLLPDDRIIAFDKTYTDKRDDTKDDLIRALRVGNDIAALMEEDGWPGLGIELTITPIYGPADQDFYDCLFPDSRSGGSDSHPSLKSVLGEPDAAYIACDKEGRVHETTTNVRLVGDRPSDEYIASHPDFPWPKTWLTESSETTTDKAASTWCAAKLPLVD